MTAPGVEYWSGQQAGWRYLAQVMDGSGVPGDWLSNELPLTDVTITDVLSGPPQFSATINPLFRSLLRTDDGSPLLRPWQCAIYPEQDGILRGGFLLVSTPSEGPSLTLDGMGFSGYAKGMAYEGDDSFVETDPIDIARHIWAHIQAGEDSDLGLVVDPYTTTGGAVLLGKALVPDADGTVSSTGSTDDGPYRLARWANDDLGADLDDLAGNSPFDYHERHVWNLDKTTVQHYLDFGYPRIGGRQGDLRFILGENMQEIPTIENDGTDYASHVRVLGAGEGSAMIVGESRVSTGGLRRMVTVDNKNMTDPGQADQAARRELGRRLLLADMPSVVVRNTPQAPLGSWGVGDEIRIQAEEDWRSVDLWFRVVSMTIKPEAPDMISMDLLRSDLV
jgi:hypothetical protein